METVIRLELGCSALKMVAAWKDGSGNHRIRLNSSSAVAQARRLVGADELRAAQTETVVVNAREWGHAVLSLDSRFFGAEGFVRAGLHIAATEDLRA